MPISTPLQIYITTFVHLEKWNPADDAWHRLPGDALVGGPDPAAAWNWPRTRTVELEATNGDKYRVVFPKELPYAQGNVVINMVLELYEMSRPAGAVNVMDGSTVLGWRVP